MNRMLVIAAVAVLSACNSGTTTKTGTGTGTSNLTASISAVVPGHVYQATTVDVTIAGFATNWDSKATVDFGGSDITVNSVTLASPTALVANVTVSASAELGVRTVKVSDGSATLSYAGGFSIAANDGSIPSISAVSPRSVFLGRTKDVLISGSGTNWNGNTTVDFGPGVTVNGSVTVASPTALLANITIDAKASAGLRDVKVTSGSSSVTFAKAFEVASPVVVTALGTQAQGSVLVLSFHNLDLENPFDTTSTGDGFFTPIVYTNFNFSLPDGYTMNVSSVTQYSAQALLLIDVKAAAQTLDLDALSGPADSITHFSAPGALNIQARTATALTATPATAMVTAPFGSTLYSFTSASTPEILDLTATASDSMAQPGMILLGSSGSFADLKDVTAEELLGTTEATTYYVIYWDQTGDSGYSFIVNAKTSDATTATPAAMDNTAANATALASLPVIVQNGNLTDTTSVDYYAVTAAAGDVGKHVRVKTYGDDPLVDTVLDVVTVDSSGTETSLGGPSQETGTYGDFTSNPIPAAGTLYVKVLPGPQAFSPGDGTYNAIIRLE